MSTDLVRVLGRTLHMPIGKDSGSQTCSERMSTDLALVLGRTLHMPFGKDSGSQTCSERMSTDLVRVLLLLLVPPLRPPQSWLDSVILS